MSREHTPGPWIVWPNGSSGYEMRDPTRFVHKANYADARLIAAAPDLLEAAKAFDDAVDSASEAGHYINDPRLRAAVRLAREAIAKAAGGEVRHRSGCKQSKEE